MTAPGRDGEPWASWVPAALAPPGHRAVLGLGRERFSSPSTNASARALPWGSAVGSATDSATLGAESHQCSVAFTESAEAPGASRMLTEGALSPAEPTDTWASSSSSSKRRSSAASICKAPGSATSTAT